MRILRKCLPIVLTVLLFFSSILMFTPASRVNASPVTIERVYDQGIDKDGNGWFDSLQIKVEVNIFSAANYYTSMYNLKVDPTGPYVSVYDYIELNLGAGIQNITLCFYGPTIRASGLTNLGFIGDIYISDFGGNSNYRTDVPLSRSYSYEEFDVAFTDMEASFKVSPDGTVDIAGMANATRMAYPAKGLNVSTSLDISTGDNLTTINAEENLTFQDWVASRWPMNASWVSAVARYSQLTGILNMGLNTTLTLQPSDPYQQYMTSPYSYLVGSQYPWNASDFKLDLGYSNGYVNGELDASTILPSTLTSVFPFNATDFTLNANYQQGMLTGTITFHIIPAFPLSDLNLDFQATRTQLTSTGTLTVIYGTYPSYPTPINVNETYVDKMIADIEALEGNGPNSMYNITKGLIELDTASFVTKTPLGPPEGVILDFNFILNGDLIGYIAYMMAGYKTYDLSYNGFYNLLNTTMTSIESGSMQLVYSCGSHMALLDVAFNANLERLLTDLFTFPPDTTPFVVASQSMRPTLEIGDLILVRNITDASEINAATYPYGDVISFYGPNDRREIIVHRAISKTYANGSWYFQTKGDYNYYPDYWTGPDTYDGMVSEKLIFGRVVERRPWIGYPILAILYGPTALLGNPSVKMRAEDIQDFLSSVITGNLKLTYTSTTCTFDLKTDLSFDALQYKSKIVPRLPDLVNPTIKAFTEDLFANAYAEIKSGEIYFTYENGEQKCHATFEIAGALSAEINYIKHLCIDQIVRQGLPVPQEQMLLVNATLLNVNDLKVRYSVVEEKGFFSFEGFTVKSPTDPVNSTSFKLGRFFNFTAPTYPYTTENPRSGERLKLTVQGGNNGTHIVTLSCPSTMPAPNYISNDQTLMSWNNLSISKLKDLMFGLQFYTGITIEGQTYPIITRSNGTVSPVLFDGPQKQLGLTIDGASGTVGYANISIPKSLLNASFDEWVIIVNSKTIIYPDYWINETADCTYLYFTFNFSSPVTVYIFGTQALSEFPLFIALPTLILVTSIVVAGGKLTKIRRRRSHQ